MDTEEGADAATVVLAKVGSAGGMARGHVFQRVWGSWERETVVGQECV